MSQQVDTLFTGGSVFLPGADSSVRGSGRGRRGADRGRRARRRARGAGRTRHRRRRPRRWSAASRLPGRARPPGDGRPGHAASASCTARRPPRSASTSSPTYAAAQPGSRVDRRRRLVDGVLPGRHPDAAGARRGRPRPAGLPHQPRRPRHLGQHPGARARRHRRGHSRPARRSDRAGRGRQPHRRPARGRGSPGRSAAPRHQRRRHVRGPAGRPGPALLARHHRLAGRRRRAPVRPRRHLPDLPGGRPLRRPQGARRRRPVVGARARCRADPRARSPAATEGQVGRFAADQRQDHAGRCRRELHGRDARALPRPRRLRHATTRA